MKRKVSKCIIGVSFIAACFFIAIPIFYLFFLDSADKNNAENLSIEQDEIKELIAETALLASSDSPALSLDVEITDGIAIIEGSVLTLEEKISAKSIVLNVDGIDSVVNNVRVEKAGVDDSYQINPSPTPPELRR